MASIAPEIVIAPPAAKAPRHSLLRVGYDLLNFDGDATAITRKVGNRWEAGVEMLAEGCDEGGVFVPCTDDTFTEGTNPEPVLYVPIVAWAPFSCGSFGRLGLDYKGRARRKLESVASHHLEREFWTGAQAQANLLPNLYLAGPTVTIVNPGATSTPLVYALGLLQQALADCMNGGEGMIHAPRQLVNLWLSAEVIDDETDRDGTIHFYDAFGNEIVAGSGYNGSAPTSLGGGIDATGDTLWAYATGPVGVAQGDIQMTPEKESQALDRLTNRLMYVASQTVAATWDGCCHFGINVSLCATCCVSPLIV